MLQEIRKSDPLAQKWHVAVLLVVMIFCDTIGRSMLINTTAICHLSYLNVNVR